jgi:ABC-2 type transport system ATP-binding protein
MAETMIEVRDLTKHFGAVQALRGVSFSIPRGQVVGLIGPNGAGKTTAMRILTGFLAPTSGTTLVDGQDVVEDPIACRRRIGYLPEGNPQYLDLRVRESLIFIAHMHGLRGPIASAAVGEAMEVAGLHGMESRLIGTVSKGYRQRVGLAAALLHKPDILILDEPSSGLDPNQQSEMRDLLRRLGEEHTVIFSTHILPEVAAVCDRVLFIHEGRLAADGTVQDLEHLAHRGPAALLVLRAEAEAVGRAFDGHAGAEVATLGADHVAVRVPATAQPVGPDFLEGLAAQAAAAGLPLLELRMAVPSLEQVFADLTGRGPSDDDEPDEPEDAGHHASTAVAFEEED